MRARTNTYWMFAAAALVACSGGTPCETTRECDAAEGASGFVCAAGVCQPCASDADCAGVARYGEGAMCGDEGRCAAACMPGESGCPCGAGDACDAGLTCQDGTCRGETGCEGCTCGSAGECDAGLECEEGVCLRDCVRGALGCACDVSGGCDEGLTCSPESDSCEACTEGALQCPCASDGACDDGLTCDPDEDVCLPGECGPGSEGTVGCACRDGAPACDGGVCRSGLCAACASNIAGCPCEAGSCVGLVCDAADDTCRPALTCAELSCADRQECVPGSATEDARCGMCEPGYAFDASTMACVPVRASCDGGEDPASILDACTMRSRRCVEAGDNARCGECVRGHLEDAGVCRPIQGCADRGCAAMHRECTPPTGASDASCAACLPGYVESGGACVVDPTMTCESIEATCAARSRTCDESGGAATCGACLSPSVVDPATDSCVYRLCADLDCASEHRECEGEPLAECTTCSTGHVEDPGTGECRPPSTCATFTCGAGFHCEQADPSRDPLCMADRPCAADETRDTYTGTCVSCPASCTGGAWAEGETGRVASGTVFAGSGNPGVCICETEPGYFAELTAGTFACDADGDGWVRQGARASIEATDPVLRANARCTLHRARGVILTNERGATHTETFAPVPLYESLRNDDALALDAASASEVPAYGARRPLPEELNGMTKLCSGAAADHNHNFVSDVSEHAGIAFPTGSGAGAVPTALAPLYTLYTRFSYYAELHQGAFVPDDPSAYDLPFPSGPRELQGRYAITERSRAAAAATGGVPLHYGRDPLDAAQNHYGACRRHRDADFATRADASGLDLAAYPDPAAPSEALMTHHSQYRCLQLVDDTTYAARDPERDRHYVRTGDLAAPSPWTVNVCSITGAPAMVSGTPNPDEPRLTCAAGEDPPPLALDQVVWGAVSYLHGATPMAGSPLAASLDCSVSTCPAGTACAGGVCRGATAIACVSAADCPAGAGWVELFNSGFLEGIKGSAVQIAETKYGDTGKEVQARLIEDMLQTHKDIDYVVGTAVTAEAAVPVLRGRGLTKEVKVVSVYMTPGVYQGLKSGAIEAAGMAPVVDAGRIAVDQAVRLIEKKDVLNRVNMLGKVYTTAEVGELNSEQVLAPASFKPVFRVNQ